jgi:hypothetical protein
MPARVETIQIVPKKSGQLSLILRFPYWWNRAAFLKKFRERELDLENPIDFNLAWLLSAVEAILWDEQCKKQFPDSEIGAHPTILSEMSQLTDALKHARWVIVESNEWESGLN